jgi:hypothetical protein
MFAIDLNNVECPKNLSERLRESHEARIKQLVGKSIATNGVNEAITEEKAKQMVGEFKFNKVLECEQAIVNCLNDFVELRFKDKERNTVIAPFEDRKRIAKIRSRVIDAEEGKFELGNEDFAYLLGAMKIEGSISDFSVFVVEYLEKLEAEAKLKSQ